MWRAAGTDLLSWGADRGQTPPFLLHFILAILVLCFASTSPARAEPLDDVLRTLNVTPAVQDQTHLAAHLETSGHWSFASRTGERFTASGAAELQRAVETLAPAAKIPGHRLIVHLSQPTLHAPTAEFAALPKSTALRAVLGKESVPVVLRPNTRPLLMITPGVALIADTERAFLAAHTHLTRRIPEFSMRVLALEPGAPRVLSSSPRVDLQTKQTLVDAVDPSSVAEALSGAPRQTVLIKGRLDGDALFTRGKSGGEMRVPLKDLEAAAAANDITLFVHGSSAAQPGGRNWLWLPVFDKVPASGASLRVVDLIATVSENTALVIAAETAGGRVRLIARPAAAETGRSSAEVWLRRMGDAAKDLLGSETPRTLIVSLPAVERQQELSRRVVGWLPSLAQFGYGGLLALGLLGWPTSRRWFARLWPAEARADYANATGYSAARAIRACLFAIVFVPLVAIVAAPAQLLRLLKRPPKVAA
jgi:hypothetical protein